MRILLASTESFFGAYKNVPWYIEQKKEAEDLALKLGYQKVAQEKGAVAKKSEIS